MPAKQRRVVFYVGCFALITVVAILALAFNIKAMHLNEKRQSLRTQMQVMHEENQSLYLKILLQNTLEKSDERAKNLDMKAPDRIEYLTVTQ